MKLYVVRNKEGKYFRAIGYGGFGQSWVDSLDKAKFYAKIGQAKARVTFFANQWPKYGVSDILEFDLVVENAKVLDMTEATEKKIAKRKEADRKEGIRAQQEQIQRLQEQMEADKRRLRKLQANK